MKNSSSDIDFVVLWVDNTDPKWREEKKYYSNFSKNNTLNEDAIDDSARFRDWGVFKYWFRGVEKFCPWVRKIHFVTWGHVPEWLDTNNPKLNIVKHEDFIPKEYLPLFNSNAIELNVFDIQDLAENFVYFNDDFFVTAPMQKSDFFLNDLPRDSAVLNLLKIVSDFDYILANEMLLINQNFNLKKVVFSNFFKWFNIKYEIKILKTIILMFSGHTFPALFSQI